MFLKDWEDFEMAAENMYLKNSSNCRYSMKYIHSKGQLLLKLTDNVKVNSIYTPVLICNTFFLSTTKKFFLSNIEILFTLQCIQYKTEIMPDLKKIEKLTGNLAAHMASNEWDLWCGLRCVIFFTFFFPFRKVFYSRKM